MSDAEYIVRYLYGPMAGTTDRRSLVAGKVEQRIDVIAAVEGLESIYWYELVEDNTIDGEILATYAFDENDSDPVAPDSLDGPA